MKTILIVLIVLAVLGFFIWYYLVQPEKEARIGPIQNTFDSQQLAVLVSRQDLQIKALKERISLLESGCHERAASED